MYLVSFLKTKKQEPIFHITIDTVKDFIVCVRCLGLERRSSHVKAFIKEFVDVVLIACLDPLLLDTVLDKPLHWQLVVERQLWAEQRLQENLRQVILDSLRPRKPTKPCMKNSLFIFTSCLPH